MCSPHVLAIGLLLVAAATLAPPESHAQSVASGCRPAGGQNYDCASAIAGPYRLRDLTCAPQSWTTEAAAFARWSETAESDDCPVTITPLGWVWPGPAPSYSVACSGGAGGIPGTFYGQEAYTGYLARVTQHSGTWPNCGATFDTNWAAVLRERGFACPEGYDWFTSDVCYRAGNQRDYAKMLGDSCPPQGQCQSQNPINIGAGNKFRAESDYRAAGSSPLAFTRYYNSLPEVMSFAHHYRDSSYELVWGSGGYGVGSLEPSEQGGRIGLIAIGTAGVGWRHTYQRAISRQTATLITSAYVYRHDGQVLLFTKYNGQWYAPADVSMALQELVDGGGAQTGWKLTVDDDSTETYDLAGRLLTIRSRAGVMQTLTYETCGRLTSVVDSFGRTLTFSYAGGCADANRVQRIAGMTVPGGGTFSYSYDADGRLTSVTDAAAKTRTYHYENTTYDTALTGITDESAQRYATFGYGTYGRANLSELAGGAERVSIAYPDTGVPVPNATVTVGGATVDYTFAVTQGLVKLGTQSAYCEGCPVNARSMTYDANGNVSIRKDFKDVETRYTYDTARNLETSRTEAYGTAKARTISTTWHSTMRLPTQIDEPNRRTAFTHDTSGNVLTRTVTDLSVTPNVSRTWTYTYNSFGQVLTEDGPRTGVSDVTTYTYYGAAATCTATVSGATSAGCRGQLATITNALSHVTAYDEYNAHGQALKITDANGLVTTMSYDAMRRLTSRSAGGETTAFEYWPTGLLKKVTLPDDSFLSYTYDAAHRLTQIADDEGNRIAYTLDAMGNRTKEETFDPSNYLTRLQHRAFNALNQLWKEIGAANTAEVTTAFGYDANGNQASISAPLGRSTSNLYDELDRLKQVTEPLGATTQFAYDANDNLTSVTDPRGLVTSYAYNGFGDVKTLTSPDTGVTTSTFDAAGNLATSTDARSKTGTHTYDALNRLSGLTFADQTIGYTYDSGTNNKGRLMQVTDGSGSTSWTYTSLGRVASRTQVMGSVTRAVGYGYNGDGQLTSVTTPSGQTITYAYANNRISGITVNSTPLLNSVLYDPFGPIRQWSWGNSSLAARSFDADGNVEQIDSAGLRSYLYDDAFRIVGITDAEDPDLDAYYGYDLADRLTEAGDEPPVSLALALSTTSAVGGDTVTATLNNIVGPATGYWLALTRTGTTSTTYNKWVAVTPSSGSFAWNVSLPAYAGTYEVRLFMQGFVKLLTSAPITVSAPPAPSQATLTASANATLPGTSVTVRLASGPGGSTDWLALALVGAPNGSYLQWTYVGSGVTNRDWTVTMPTTEDDYEFRLFLNNGYTLAATSAAVYVTDDAPVTGGAWPGDYAYDANGNRLAGEGSAYTISSTSNRLSSVSGALTRTYGYDAAGNTTSYGGFTFAYNDAGRMTSVSGSASASYAHNALGQRVKKTVGSTTTYFVYDESGHLIGEYDGSGNLIQETVWLEDIPVATLRPNGGGIAIFYIHTDHLNTPRRITRPSDDGIVWRWDSGPSGPFGTAAPDQDPDGDATQFVYHLRFPGQYFDAETQLSYNYFRDYDPAIGRYVESDPIGLDGGLNTYVYVGSAPTMYSDATGELWQIPVLFCARLPRVCKEILRCMANPAACRDRICKYGAMVYHASCNIPGCQPGDAPAAVSFKLASAEACLAGRLFVRRVCKKIPDPGHNRELEIAGRKIADCQRMLSLCH